MVVIGVLLHVRTCVQLENCHSNSSGATCPGQLDAVVATPARMKATGKSGGSLGPETEGVRGDPLTPAVKQQAGLGYTAIGEHASSACPTQMISLLSLLFGI